MCTGNRGPECRIPTLLATKSSFNLLGCLSTRACICRHVIRYEEVEGMSAGCVDGSQPLLGLFGRICA